MNQNIKHGAKDDTGVSDDVSGIHFKSYKQALWDSGLLLDLPQEQQDNLHESDSIRIFRNGTKSSEGGIQWIFKRESVGGRGWPKVY